MEGTYEAVGGAMKFCQLMQILEIMHPLFGYTKGGVINPFMQVSINNIANIFSEFGILLSKMLVWFILSLPFSVVVIISLYFTPTSLIPTAHENFFTQH